MKAKGLNKKLSLNKKTISHLDQNDMREAIGGGTSKLTQCGCSVIVCIITEEQTCTCPTTN